MNESVFSRREFIGGAMAFAGAGCMGPRVAAYRPDPERFIKAMLIHLGSNMWCDEFTPANHLSNPCVYEKNPSKYYWGDKTRVDYLRADHGVWTEVTAAMAKAGHNMIVIDLGEALEYPSHPELAVKGTWSTGRMREELARLRELGLEPIPKLNFSTTHNAWMKDWRHQVSSPAYMETVKELIEDAVEVFDGPRFVHIGYDEETMGHQGAWGRYEYIVVRRGKLWWKDFLYTADCVRNAGARPWCFSDQIWYERELFLENMPKDVVQTPWNCAYDKKRPWYVESISDLAKLGLDVIPDCACYPAKEQIEEVGDNKLKYIPIDRNDDTKETKRMIREALKRVPAKQLRGFLGCTWVTTTPGIPRDVILDAVDYFGTEFARAEKERSLKA